MNKKTKRVLSLLLLTVLVPVFAVLGLFLFEGENYALVSALIAITVCSAFFLSFERKETSARRIIVIAALTALSVAGRFIFAFVPAFKPVTAMVVISALYMGGEAGFLVGALTAVVSNLYFGQGPWTPFQMLAWGLVGLFAGILSKPLKRNRVLLSIYGVLAGVAYSLMMDVWTVCWYDGSFNPSLYLTALAASLPHTVAYAVSNVIFLLALTGPIGEKLERLQKKYGI